LPKLAEIDGGFVIFFPNQQGDAMLRKQFQISLAALVCCAVLVACEKTQAADAPAKVRFGAAQPPPVAVNPQGFKDFRFAVADLSDQLIPVVVSIQTEAVAKNVPMQMDPFEFFFGPQGRSVPEEQPRQQGLGSGVIVSAAGHILTNNHVVEGADAITVTLSDKLQYKAKVVGTDPQTDLAVIQLEKAPDKLPVAYLGSSQALRVGEWVVAIGNPYGLSQTVTTGIVSAKGVHNRGITSYENFIQTDAAINPGNSGGALFNLSGELVGINTAILSRSGGFQGIGFAIPVDLAKSVMEDLVQYGKVSRGWLGVSIQDVDPALAKAMNLGAVKGALINEVFENSPAAKAGLKPGDVVVSLKGLAVSDANVLRNQVAILKPGEKADFEVLRDGKKIKLQVVVSRRDEDNLAGADPTGSDAVVDSLGLGVAALTDAQRQAAKLDKSAGGVLVQSVKRGSLVAQAGLKEGDIVLAVNQKAVADVASFKALMKAHGKSPTLLLLIRRGTGQYYVVIER
jgi:serine protease Do